MKLKPCPFCGSTDIDTYETDTGIMGLRGYHYVMCGDCYAETSKMDKKQDAVKLWNRRAK